MTPLLDANKAMTEAQEAFNELRQYKSTEQYRKMVDWIESLIVQQQVQMLNCGADKLEASQIRLKQLVMLRSALVDAGGAFTGFVF